MQGIERRRGLQLVLLFNINISTRKNGMFLVFRSIVVHLSAAFIARKQSADFVYSCVGYRFSQERQNKEQVQEGHEKQESLSPPPRESKWLSVCLTNRICFP